MTISKQVSLHGNRAYLSTDDKLVAKNGFAAGGEGVQAGNKAGTIVLPGSPGTVAVFDDFTGPTTNNPAFDTGGDLIGFTQDWIPAADWAHGFQDSGMLLTKPDLAGGVARLTSSASSGQTPITGAMSLHGGRNWKANAGGLRMGARVKIETLAGSQMYVGFTDTGGSEMPVYDSGATAATSLTPAADFVGWLWSGALEATVRSRTNWRMVAGKNGTDQDTASSVAPTANVYDVPEVAINADGKADFFMNGKYVGTLENAVTTNVGLAPAVYAVHQEGAAKYFDIDWMNASGNRDTGE